LAARCPQVAALATALGESQCDLGLPPLCGAGEDGMLG